MTQSTNKTQKPKAQKPKPFVFCALFVFWFLCFVSFAYAQDTNVQYNLIQPLPGVQSVSDFPKFVSIFIPFLLGLAGLLSLIQIVRGGIMRAVSGGNPSAIGDANDMIWQAILGLILALSAYLILFTINPDLVNLKFEPLNIRIESSGEEATKMKNAHLNELCEGKPVDFCGEPLKCKRVKFGNEFIFQCRP